MEINGTEAADTVVGTQSDTDWHNYYGKGGDDFYQLYQGAVLGGPGADHIERLPSTELWRQVRAAYWDSPHSVVADLQAGWADDGWGSRDTLIGVTQFSGSWHGDTVFGSSADDLIDMGGGVNVVDGRGGDDIVYIPDWGRGLSAADFTINVSIDGKSATITYGAEPGFKTTMSNVERLGIHDGSWTLAEFIKPADMADIGLVAGPSARWNASGALGTPVTLSFSFAASAPASGVGATGFQSFSTAQRDAVRAILADVGAATGLTFLEQAGGGQLSFGASAQSATKGVAALPGQANAGQVWMDVDSLRDITRGTEGYAALLHEIGHALGLRHPVNVDPGDTNADQWRVEDALASMTVMAQAGSGDGLFPSTYSAYDIAALRYLYGSEAINLGDTRYVLSGLRQLSDTSIVDDGGNDTIDASSAQAGCAIDLRAGHLSSVGVSANGLAAIGNLSLGLDTVIENAVGSAFDDVITGNAADNVLTGAKGNDWIDGGAGRDTAVFAGARSDYLVSSGFGKLFVSARDGSAGFDTLLSVEVLRFADQTVVLGSGAFGADLEIGVDQNASVAGQLPAASDASTGVRYTVLKGPASGTLQLGLDGAFVYTPQAGFAADDSFTYTLANSAGAANVYTGFVTVRAVAPNQAGSARDDHMNGSGSDDIISALAGNDNIAGSAGNDHIDGGSGRDVLAYAGLRADYTIAAGAGGTFSVQKALGAGTDSLSNVERLLFADGAIALDIGGIGGTAYRIYQAAFNRTPDQGGLGFWVAMLDQGLTGFDIAAGFVASAEFKAAYGDGISNLAMVTQFYQNILHRAPEAAGRDYWVGALNAHVATTAQVLSLISDSQENQDGLAAVIGNGFAYTPYLA